jgi:hypothetical protein
VWRIAPKRASGRLGNAAISAVLVGTEIADWGGVDWAGPEEESRVKLRTFVVLTLLAMGIPLVGPGRALAQYTNPKGEPLEPQTLNVGFPFQVADKILPAGTYTIEQPSAELLVLRDARRNVVEMPVILRVAKLSPPIKEPKVIFDKFGDDYYISEIWVPDRDGFVVGGTKEVHTHHAVTIYKKK